MAVLALDSHSSLFGLRSLSDQFLGSLQQIQALHHIHLVDFVPNLHVLQQARGKLCFPFGLPSRQAREDVKEGCLTLFFWRVGEACKLDSRGQAHCPQAEASAIQVVKFHARLITSLW